MELLIVLGIGVLIALQLYKAKAPADADAAGTRAQEEIGELKEQLKKERSEKDELAGKGKQLYTSFKDLEADYKSATHERELLHKRIAEYEAKEESREKEKEHQITQLNAAKKSLEEERARVTKEDEQRAEQELAERDRLWAEHEETVVSLFVELCKKPQFQFTLYDNTNLPEGFDGSFKPDVLIGFLGQYIIFDAKVSRSDNFQNYISTQVQSTAKKAKSRSDIYPSIFLVVPTDAIAELKEVVYYEDGYTFYIISPEAVCPILASLKKITTYEFAEQFDPQERENIINLIAKLDNHISARNSMDISLAEMGSDLLRDSHALHPEIAKEVQDKRLKMRIPNFKPSALKKLIASVDARDEAINKLTEPKAAIDA